MKDNAHKRFDVLRNWFAPFSEAWEMLIEVPLPRTGHRHEDSEPALVLFNFPLVGAFISLISLVVACLLSYVMGKLIFAAVFAVFFTVFLEFLTKCKNLSITSSFFENRFSGLSSYESFMELNEELNSQRGPVGTIGLLLLFLFKTFCVGALAYHGQIFWILPALAVSCAVQAHLAVVESIKDSRPFVEANDGDVIKMWVVTAVVVLIFSFCFKSISAPVLLLIIAFMGISLFRKYCVEILDGVTGNIISFAGYISEIIFLLLGVLLLVRN